MKTKWTPLAKKQWKATARYILRMFGKQTKDSFMEEVRQTAELLGEQPYMGKIEPYLAHRPVKYRSIVVNRLNKIVYRIDDDAFASLLFGTPAANQRNKPNKLNSTIY